MDPEKEPATKPQTLPTLPTLPKQPSHAEVAAAAAALLGIQPKLPVQKYTAHRGVRCLLKTSPIEFQDQKRRSSSRSIKRKRFDDEIVEYSMVPQNRNSGDQHRVGRPRTTSQTHQGSQQQGLQTSPQTSSSSQNVPTSTVLPTLANSGIVSSTSSIDSKAKSLTPEAKKSSLLTTANLSNFSITTTPATSATPHITSSVHNTSTMNTPASLHTGVSSGYSTERRRPGRSSRRTRRTGRIANHMATKDLGRWKPIDDLALIFAVQQTNDLRIIQRSVKFSCRFTLQEMQARWNSLMFEPTISRLAVAGIRNLHPEMIEAVQNKALFSVQEEDLLSQIKSTDNPKLEQFQELLDNNAMIFFSSRTAKSLQSHWCEMKKYELLCDQVIKPTLVEGKPMSFSDAEDLIVDGELSETRDEALEIELRLHDRQQKRQVRILETELSRWNVLVDSITNSNIAPDFDSQTLAILRGRAVRYLMRSKEITFGRTTKDTVVDVDLTLEGPATKISRRQGTIKLRSNGDFFISNEGKRPIFINGSPILNGNKTRLFNNAILEMSGLRFVFLVNYELITAIRHESAKTTAPLN